uniref:Uncharacterized protein n=1 Tax=Arundo donax TaxID=35708 RepID=A0A0A9E6W1_ARUDO
MCQHLLLLNNGKPTSMSLPCFACMLFLNHHSTVYIQLYTQSIVCTIEVSLFCSAQITEAL